MTDVEQWEKVHPLSRAFLEPDKEGERIVEQKQSSNYHDYHPLQQQKQRNGVFTKKDSSEI